MADTRAATGLTAEQWDDKFFMEYLTENRFAGEMGTDELNIIQVKENLTKKPGDRINFALVNKLVQDAVLGSATMEGNEEDLISRSFELPVNKRRNAVRMAEVEEGFSAISLRNAAKAALKEWSMEDTEKLIIQSLASINGVNFADSTDGERDAWLTDNADRVYFASGYAGADHSAGLTEQDTSADKLTAADITAMKYKALVTANPKIRPIRSKKNGRHYFVLYCDPRCFRDLKGESNSPILQAQREVSIQLENDRLFQGGDMLWDGVIIKEIHEMFSELGTPFANLGDGATTEIGCAFLCGAQAVGTAYARRWKTVTEDFDYGDKHGVEISAVYGIKKMLFGSGVTDTADLKDHGVVTGYFATTN
jgi:N4-gp56 family major capsid protein